MLDGLPRRSLSCRSTRRCFGLAPGLGRQAVPDLGLLDHRLLPAGACLHPEDRGDDRLAAVTGRLPEEVCRDLGVGLDVAVVEFVAVVLAEGLGVDADDAGDVGLGDAEAGKRLDLSPGDRIGLVWERGPWSGLLRNPSRSIVEDRSKARRRSVAESVIVVADGSRPVPLPLPRRTWPLPSRTAVSPVNSCQRRMATST